MKFVKKHGRRKFYVQERVEIHDINDSSSHQSAMGELAARAVRWFAEQAVEIEWHTLEFRVVGTETDQNDDETAQLWRWEVWVS